MDNMNLFSYKSSINDQVKTYVFPVALTEEHDGRWSVVCPVLNGCASLGRSRGEALENIREAVEAYVADMIEAHDPLPEGIRVLDTPAVSVTV